MIPLLLAACAPKVAIPAAPAPQKADPAAQMVADIQALNLRDLGNPVLRWDWIPSPRATAEQPHRPLVVLAEFSDTHFDRFAGDPQQDQELTEWYQEQLFDPTYQKKDTISHFYAVQSGGLFHVDGTVLPPVKLDKPLAAYGAPIRPEGGDWRNDRGTEDLVEDVLKAAWAQQGDLDWHQFDRWDPKDYDGDGVTDEPDGYIDHLVIIYAGRGQHSCQRLREIDQALNPNVGPEAYEALNPEQKACADRIWPHRADVQRREGEGPLINAQIDAAGGVPLADDLWARSYNMQCEYTGNATFIHEIGHSFGLPDLYARTSSNSTGSWDTMSGTTSPSPQSFSAWDRLVLGWLQPQVIVPPEFGGADTARVDLGTLDSTGEPSPAALIALPPSQRSLDLGPLPDGSTQALYSGQGNELNRSATARFTVPEGAILDFDAWWEIEGGWDFAYIELSADEGHSWQRLLPTDLRQMPAKHGHDGPQTLPGLTGLSGDLDGDGKDESAQGCDPTAELAAGEDRATATANPCEQGSWVHLSFDLAQWRGQPVQVRWRYFTDGAAVENGLMLDNVKVGDALSEDFEGPVGDAWTLDGFSLSTGHHDLLVPQYMLLEYRDPATQDPNDYDAALGNGSLSFYDDPETHQTRAVWARPQAGVLAWRFDGAYAWSENDPALNGPGKGSLLVIDSTPNEIPLPGFESLYQGDPAKFDTHYDVDGVQEAMKEAYYRTVCFMRPDAYVPPKLDPDAWAQFCQRSGAPAVQSIAFGDQHLLYGNVWSDLLPGEAQAPWRRAGELLDARTKKDGTTRYRMYDRGLRHLHTFDAPFSATPGKDGLIFYTVEDGTLVEQGRRDWPASPRFSDNDPRRWLNPELPFGGAAVPIEGLSFEVQEPAADAPTGTRATVVIHWDRQTEQ